MGKPARPCVLELPREALAALLVQTAEKLSAEEHALVESLVSTLTRVTDLVRTQGTTIARLRRLFGLASSEKTADVLGGHSNQKPNAPAPDPAAAGDVPPAGAPSPGAGGDGAAAPPGQEGAPGKKKRKGHGRRPASDYEEAHHIIVTHEQRHAGGECPSCARGTLYNLKEPARILRIVGQAPLVAVCWDCERLRCSACGEIFTAKAPEEAQGPKHTETAVSMMALLRYGTGMPLHRLERVQHELGTPVPGSTQWDLVHQRSKLVQPVFDELRRLAAQAPFVHTDDTHARILQFMGKRRAELLARGQLPNPDRTGLFTTAIVASTADDRHIALFCTGRQHAGENLASVLDERGKELSPAILMCDGLDRNVPKGHVVIQSNCLAHGRRHVVDEVTGFPSECRHLLDAIGAVFKLDERCRTEGLSPEQRLLLHQRESGPIMADLEKWMRAQMDEKRVEPNSGLGQAMNYLLKRWDKLTLFLRVPGAKLDNNISERAIKSAIRHRNNSLFYKTQNGATVGDIWMTLIYTTALNDGNPFHYLTSLQLHDKAVAERPGDWLPWNYRATLAALAQATSPTPPTAPDSRPPSRALT